jgi:hypothetical protein
MPNRTDIANQSLDLVNVATISDLDGTDAKSQRCKRIYEFDLPEVFEETDWNFGKARGFLGANQMATAPVNGWTYAYKLPENCRRPIRINGDDSVAWAEENGNLLTNAAAPIVLEFVQDISDPNKWTGKFRRAFVNRLASDYNKAFKGGDGRNQLQEYENDVNKAIARNGQTGTPPRPTVNTLTTAIRRY